MSWWSRHSDREATAQGRPSTVATTPHHNCAVATTPLKPGTDFRSAVFALDVDRLRAQRLDQLDIARRQLHVVALGVARVLLDELDVLLRRGHRPALGLGTEAGSPGRL